MIEKNLCLMDCNEEKQLQKFYNSIGVYLNDLFLHIEPLEV